MKKFLLLFLFLPSLSWAGRYANFPVATNVSLASSFNSYGVDVNQLTVMAFQAVWTGGSASGSLKVQVSNDNVPYGTGNDPAANVVNWTDYTGSSTTVSGAGNFLWNMTFSGYHWARLVYTSVSGTGTINATFSGKGE